MARPGDEQTPKFRSQTNLVLIPVTVRSHGQHVPDLKQDAFTVLEDGKPQKVATFEEIRTSTKRLERVPVGPREFTNQLSGSPETARYVVIAIDRINTAPLDLALVRDGLKKFLAQTASNGEPIRLISIETQGIRLIQDFTTDPKAVAEALDRGTKGTGPGDKSSIGLNDSLHDIDAVVNTEGASGAKSAEEVARYMEMLDRAKNQEQQALAFQERNARISSLGALQQIAQSLSGLPGRKSLVWASSGYAFSSIAREGRTNMNYDFSQVSEATSLDAYTTHMLNSANIAMYPVDARGMKNTAWDAVDPAHKYAPTEGEKDFRQRSNQDVVTTFERLASGTGGKACYNRPELTDCFKEALDDSRDYYMVGFYVDSKATKDGWHKLQVKVDEKGTNVRSRNGFLFPLPDPAKTREMDMNTAVRSLLSDAGIPFRGEWTTTQKKGEKVANGLVVQVVPEAHIVGADSNKLNMEFAAVARAKDGSIAGSFSQKVQKDLPPEAVAMIQRAGLTYKNSLDLAPGQYLVRIVVRDNNTGKTGAVNSLITVQ
jgi:VWFA-related protein